MPVDLDSNIVSVNARLSQTLDNAASLQDLFVCPHLLGSYLQDAADIVVPLPHVFKL